MVGPPVRAGMKEAGKGASFGVEAGEVWTFVFVAAGAGPAEVFQRGGSTVLFGNEVVELETQFRVLLREPAVFAAESGAAADSFPELGRDAHGSGGGLQEGAAGLGLEELKGAADGEVAFEFAILIRGEPALAGFGGEGVGTVQILGGEVNFEEDAGHRGIELAGIGSDGALPNCDGGGNVSGGFHTRDS